MKSILFNAEMTKAILDGRKSQTRRAIKVDTIMYDNPTLLEPDSCVKFNFSAGGCQNHSSPPLFINSKYQKGDIVWIREPVKIDMCFTEEIHFHYLADNTTSKLGIPKRFIKDGFVVDWMSHCNGIPNGCIKEMARIFLKITDVRVERLQSISASDVEAEGTPYWDNNLTEKECRKLYTWRWANLWNKTAQKGYKWEDNPYVFVYKFERVNKDGSDYE
ncbi:hypothetical protein [Sulfurimonas sp. NWX79]|uniref:hypothetical protein n=1 Tax=Campylobacterales TaxID=213849 RepID=UPI003204DAB7|nr:hypothetical protein IAPFLPAM_00013 [Sulfurimonas phage SNW-1]